ncbi:MAG: hypothetical protein ACRETO_01120 [Gammaproteobacteria bacterium]
MRKFVSAFGLLTVLAVSGCGSLPCGNPHAYYSNTSGAPLKVPAGLSKPASDPAYAIPGEKPATGKRTDLDATGACLAAPPQVITPESSVTPKSGAATTAPPAAVKQKPSAPAQPVPAAGSVTPPAVATGGPIG